MRITVRAARTASDSLMSVVVDDSAEIEIADDRARLYVYPRSGPAIDVVASQQIIVSPSAGNALSLDLEDAR